MWLELKHFGTLALHCPIADRDWAMQASGTQNQKCGTPKLNCVKALGTCVLVDDDPPEMSVFS
jgi:hypothetical protein